MACASPIITAIGSSIVKHNGSWSFLPAVWFVTLGIAIALLIAMLVLVIFEAMVASGTMPGPLYLIRGLHKRARRVRRYSQIGRILLRRGMLPYLRGTRRTELQTHDGREQLAGSLRLALEDGSVTFIKLGQLLATRRDSQFNPGKSQGRPNEKHGLEAHRSKRPTRLRSPKKPLSQMDRNLRSEPDRASKKQFHASRCGVRVSRRITRALPAPWAC